MIINESFARIPLAVKNQNHMVIFRCALVYVVLWSVDVVLVLVVLVVVVFRVLVVECVVCNLCDSSGERNACVCVGCMGMYNVLLCKWMVIRQALSLSLSYVCVVVLYERFERKKNSTGKKNEIKTNKNEIDY